MVQIIFADLKAEAKQHAKKGLGKGRRHVTRANGRSETLYRLDVTSPNFGAEFAIVFQSAVTQARRENKRLIGSADVEPAKG